MLQFFARGHISRMWSSNLQPSRDTSVCVPPWMNWIFLMFAQFTFSHTFSGRKTNRSWSVSCVDLLHHHHQQQQQLVRSRSSRSAVCEWTQLVVSHSLKKATCQTKWSSQKHDFLFVLFNTYYWLIVDLLISFHLFSCDAFFYCFYSFVCLFALYDAIFSFL